jgi:hypothetical protein
MCVFVSLAPPLSLYLSISFSSSPTFKYKER